MRATLKMDIQNPWIKLALYQECNRVFVYWEDECGQGSNKMNIYSSSKFRPSI